mmetsp:Transcript_6889/g.9526  ORF Transcript_6889/g.9526 Transcript_6889/m.9526 type:complete len:103 (+) Transcript_6889:29-337(+)
MKSINLSLLAASVSAVRTQDGRLSQLDSSDSLFDSLTAKIEEQVTRGSISVVDDDNLPDIDEAMLELTLVKAVDSPAEQIESVLGQVVEGFGLIREINAEAE